MGDICRDWLGDTEQRNTDCILTIHGKGLVIIVIGLTMRGTRVVVYVILIMMAL
jgi:hypothetical protein